MNQGLRLLIQLILEFAPVIANIVQKRTEAHLAITQSQYPPPEIQQPVKLIDKEKTYEYQETVIKIPEINRILENWPLRLSPTQILESHASYARTPLKIFLAPPQIKFDKFQNREEGISEIELMLAEGVREFLNNHYSLQNPIRPTEFLAGAWDSKRFHSESSIKALFGLLKTEPILILESEADGDYLNFRIGYWGIDQTNYYYKTIARLPYKEIIYQSVKNRALEWKKIRDELVFLEDNLDDINQIGGDNVINLAFIEKLEKWKEKGIDISKLCCEYQVNRQDFEKLCQVLISCNILAASWVADAFHLIHHNVRPLLPELLPSMLKDSLDLQSVQAIATGYKQVYQALEIERRNWVPELSLQLAHSLSHLSQDSLAKEQVDYSINTWLQLHQISPEEENEPLQTMLSSVSIEDEGYLQKLKEYFAAVGDRQKVTYVEELLNAISNLKYKQQHKYTNHGHTLKGHSGKVLSVAISPDGQTLVSGSADETIKIWNLKTGQVTRTLMENLGKVSSVAVSPDGNFLALGTCNTPRSNVKVWNLATGKLLHTLLGHQKPVYFVIISPDGQFIASGSNKIKIWNINNGDRICTLWHSSPVNTAVISPDGKILISGSSDHKIRLWNPLTGEPLKTLSAHSKEVNSIVISPNGQIMATGSADKTIKIWHLEAGKVLCTLTGHLDEVKSLVVSPDGKTLLSASADTTIKMWCLSTGELLQTLTGHAGAVNCLAIMGGIVASGSADKTIRIWQC